MPRSTVSSIYGSPPPSYKTVATSGTYGTLGGASRPPAAHGGRTYGYTYNYNYNRPTSTSEASETSSLWSRTTSPPETRAPVKTSLILWGIVAMLFAIVLAQNTGYMSTLMDDVSLSEKAAIRRKWRLEKELWVMEKEQWRLEEARHQEEVAMWEREREERREEREAFEREKEEWARQRREEERHRKDVEWRRRGAYWSEPWAGSWQCSGYGTRPYSANLIDLPGDVNWLEACMDMPIMINGQWMDGPSKCERDNRHIWGTWFVDFGEPQCVPYWDPIRDMGCSPGQGGMRRYEARLMNLRHGDDWDLMCRTTPGDIHGAHFDHPTSCEDKNGRTGVWDVPDGWC